jgi:hypothetical protein
MPVPAPPGAGTGAEEDEFAPVFQSPPANAPDSQEEYDEFAPVLPARAAQDDESSLGPPPRFEPDDLGSGMSDERPVRERNESDDEEEASSEGEECQPEPILHSAVLGGGEEEERRRQPRNATALAEGRLRQITAAVDPKEIPPRYYHAHLGAASVPVSTLYEKMLAAGQGEEAPEALDFEAMRKSRVIDDESDALPEGPFPQEANAALRQYARKERIPEACLDDLADSVVKCKLCGLVDLDKRKVDPKSQSGAYRSDSVHAPGGDEEGGRDIGYSYAGIQRTIISTLGTLPPEASCALAELQYFNEVYREHSSARYKITAGEMYIHFFGSDTEDPHVIEPACVQALQVRNIMKLQRNLVGSMKITNAITGDQSTCPRSATAYLKTVQLLKHVYDWDVSKMSFHAAGNHSDVTAALVTVKRRAKREAR